MTFRHASFPRPFQEAETVTEAVVASSDAKTEAGCRDLERPYRSSVLAPRVLPRTAYVLFTEHSRCSHQLLPPCAAWRGPPQISTAWHGRAWCSPHAPISTPTHSRSQVTVGTADHRPTAAEDEGAKILLQRHAEDPVPKARRQRWRPAKAKGGPARATHGLAPSCARVPYPRPPACVRVHGSCLRLAAGLAMPCPSGSSHAHFPRLRAHVVAFPAILCECRLASAGSSCGDRRSTVPRVACTGSVATEMRCSAARAARESRNAANAKPTSLATLNSEKLCVGVFREVVMKP